ncbi:hypothetical protein IWQ60_005612 [Tieghemiomyces parasiticus]|nr:hypothetical protein IWQ60_005612 [Tieghemiomyces parasiticus]
MIGRWKASFAEAYTTGDTKWVRISIITIFAQCIVMSVIEVVLIILHNEEVRNLTAISSTAIGLNKKQFAAARKNAEAVPVYFALYIAAQLFQVYLCLNATYNKNTIQVIALAVFNVCLSGYSVVQVFQRDRAIAAMNDIISFATGSPVQNDGAAVPRSLEFAAIGVAIVFSLGLVYQAYRLYQVYGWSIYKKIGADMHMRSIYRTYQVFIVFLKVDVYFFIGFSIQYIVLVILPNSAYTDLAVHIVMSLVASITMLTIAYFSVRREHRIGMIAFLLGCVAMFVYFIIKLYTIHNPAASYLSCEPACPDLDVSCRANCVDKFGNSRIVLSMFLVVDCLLDALTAGVAYMTLRNFGKNLKFHLTKQPSSIGMVNLDGQDPNKRWSIT